MAEFCKKCFDKDFGNRVRKNEKIVMSKEKELCEGCGVWDYTVDKVENKGFLEGLVEFIKGFGV